MIFVGSLSPALLTVVLAVVFTGWSWYAFAAAGLVREPPRLRQGLWAIAFVYTARGASVVPETIALVSGTATIPPRFAVFSLISLVTGIAFALGAWYSRTRGGRS